MVDENQEQPTGGRQLTAAEANQLAQQFDDEARGVAGQGDAVNTGAGARPVGEASAREGNAASSPEAATAGYKPLEGQEREELAGVFPPDVDPTVDLGGSAEEQAALREEYKR